MKLFLSDFSHNIQLSHDFDIAVLVSSPEESSHREHRPAGAGLHKLLSAFLSNLSHNMQLSPDFDIAVLIHSPEESSHREYIFIKIGKFCLNFLSDFLHEMQLSVYEFLNMKFLPLFHSPEKKPPP